MLTSKDLLLLLLYVPGHTGQQQEPIRGRTRLQKMVFLFEKELLRKFKFDKVITEQDLPVFVPLHYGPFSKQVFDDLEFLCNLDFIEIERDSDDLSAEEEEAEEYLHWLDDSGLSDRGASLPLETTEVFRLTERGASFVRERLLPTLSDNQVGALEMFKKNCTKVSLGQLLKYVYAKYPEFTEKSKIKSKIAQSY